MDIGYRQTLKVKDLARGGFVLADDNDETAFLAAKFAGDSVEIGDDIEVFVYPGKMGEVFATTQVPTVTVGEFGVLEVVELAGPGAYLDWGIERDLLVPFSLQHRKLAVGQKVVVACDIDEDNRVFASTKLAEFFDRDLGDLAVKDEVKVVVYGFNEYGVLLVVNGRYTGMAYHNEVFRELEVGDETTAWVKELRDDGRIDVSLQQSTRKGREAAQELVLTALREQGGFLGLTDKSAPGEIRQVLQMSKKAFKKAIGGLYKDRLITLEPNGIRLVDEA